MMPEQKYRTLHTPAAAEDLETEKERSNRALMARMAELERKNQALEEQLSQLQVQQPDPPEEPEQPATTELKAGNSGKKRFWPVLALAAVGVILILINVVGKNGSGQESSGQPAATASQSQQDSIPGQIPAEPAPGQLEDGGEEPDQAELQTPEREGTGTYSIGICQLVQHESLDQAVQGFKDALTDQLGEAVVFWEENAQGDSAACTAAAAEFADAGTDLILAVATPALRSAAEVTAELGGAPPVLGTCVTDYAAALGLEEGAKVTGINVSGTSDQLDPEFQGDYLVEMIEANGMQDPVIGLLYDSNNPCSVFQCEGVQEKMEQYGIQTRWYDFSAYSSAEDAVSDAVWDCDLLFAASDNIASVRDGTAIWQTLLSANVPLVATDVGTLELCGVVQLEVDYYELGYATGQMAYEILVNGADVSRMEIRYAEPAEQRKIAALTELLSIYIP